MHRRHALLAGILTLTLVVILTFTASDLLPDLPRRHTPSQEPEPEPNATPQPLLPCVLCNTPLQNRAFQYPAHPGFACPACHAAFPPCVHCGLPSTPKKEPEPGTDTTPVCQSCHASRLDTDAELLALWHLVREDAEAHLGMRIPERVTVSFFSGTAGQKESTHATPAGTELGRFLRNGTGGRILVRRHLPRELTYETLAHEAGHAWVAAQVPDGMPFLEEEGFCLWVSAKLLTARGMHRRRILLDARADAFGQAYRAWLARERNGEDPPTLLQNR